jgi:holo-[acyl-carrier protein] synthase
MPDFGVGVDVLEPTRLQQSIERRPAILQRIFTPGEIAYASTRGDALKHLTGRFCVKEAVTKALELAAFEPTDIEVLGGGEGVSVALHGDAARRADKLGADLRVSIAHTHSVAIAFAVCTTVDAHGGPP